MEAYDEKIQEMRDEIAVRDLPEGRLKVEQIKKYKREAKSLGRKTYLSAIAAAVLLGATICQTIYYANDGKGFNAGRGLLLGIVSYVAVLIINESVETVKARKETENKEKKAKEELHEIRKQNEVDKKI